MRSIALVLSLAGLFGCAAGGEDMPKSPGDPGGIGGGGLSLGSGAGLGSGADLGSGTGPGSGTGGPTAGCTSAAQLVYVLSDTSDLYSFAPMDKAFTKIGHIGCHTTMVPNSMAVDRNATAWVNYVESDPNRGEDTAGALFKVSTHDGSCESTSIALDDGWFRVGMGFSLNGTAGDSETLFVTSTPGTPGAFVGSALGRIDFGTMALAPIGRFDGLFSGYRAELTGTGDGRLFSFFTTTPVQIATLDKASGSVHDATPLLEVETPQAWAFSFWGGDIYLYTAPDRQLEPTRTTNVTRYRPSDGSVDTAYMTDIGFTIVGAGVSTCAPIDSPK